MTDPTETDTPLAKDTEAMADVTRKHADKEDADQRTPVGSHDMPAGSSASDMARQHVTPTRD